MSATASPDYLLETRGVSGQFDAMVVATAFDRAGTTAAFALGDGSVQLATAGQFQGLAAHDGAVLALATDAATGFVSGGDDGRLRHIAPDASVSDIAGFGAMKWVEHIATHDAGKGLRACAVGRVVHVFDGAGKKLRELAHPSTVSGIAFDAKGKRIAASHYGGASLWFVGSKEGKPRLLEWKGSHIGVTISPAGDHVVTAMQENSLHGWRLEDGQHMRMSGYPGKTRFLSFTKNGKWLASSGAESVVLWPFFGGGPMGKAPTELAGGDQAICTAVASHPQHDAVAAGFDDGLVVLTDINSARVLPVAAPGRGKVTALAWARSGTHLAFGTDTGFCAVVDFSKQA